MTIEELELEIAELHDTIYAPGLLLSWISRDVTGVREVFSVYTVLLALITQLQLVLF